MPEKCQIERQRLEDDRVQECGVPLFSPDLQTVGACASCLQDWKNPHSRITERGEEQVASARAVYDGPGVFTAYNMIEKDGKTWRDHNLEKTHELALGDVVEVDLDLWAPGHDKRDDGEPVVEVKLKGTCRLYVVMLMRDCDGTPLYGISNIPVKYPEEGALFSRAKMQYETVAKVFEHGYSAESLRPTGHHKDLYESVADFFGV